MSQTQTMIINRNTLAYPYPAQWPTKSSNRSLRKKKRKDLEGTIIFPVSTKIGITWWLALVWIFSYFHGISIADFVGNKFVSILTNLHERKILRKTSSREIYFYRRGHINVSVDSLLENFCWLSSGNILWIFWHYLHILHTVVHFRGTYYFHVT